MSSGRERPDLTVAQAQQLVARFTPGYQVERLLAAGNFGQVFFARDALKEVAIKIVPLPTVAAGTDQVKGPADSRDWRRLISRTDLLHHPSLIRIRDFFQHDAHGLIYMDYWPWNLRTCVQTLQKNQRLTPHRQRSLLTRFAELLHRLLDDTGLLMTDLKPSNILVRECLHGPMTLALADLGGLHRQGAAAFQRVETTRFYWAPELRDGSSNEVDETALIFSWGLVAYLILEGNSIKQNEGEDSFTGQEPVPWIKAMDDSLAGCRALVERCLQRERQARFKDFATLARALRREEYRWQRGEVDSCPQVGETFWREPVTGMTFVYVPGGRFFMGQRPEEREPLTHFAGEKKYQSWFMREVPRHEVTVDGFWLSQSPVTVGQFNQFMEESLHLTDAEQEGWAFGLNAFGWGEWEGVSWRQPGFAQGEDHPVVCVSWFDAKKFCQWLSRRTGLTFTLPSEAQWEYACRAGSDEAYAFGPTISDHQANFAASKLAATTPVGRYAANAFGLYDMHGNVWEWCEDGFDAGFYATPQAREPNPLCRHGGGYRVRRGGSWHYQAEYVRAAYRGRNYPDSSYADIGFRILCLGGKTDSRANPAV